MTKWALLFSLICVSTSATAHKDYVLIDAFLYELKLAKALLPKTEKKMRNDLRHKKLFLIGGENIDVTLFQQYKADILDALSDLHFLEELWLENLELTQFPVKLTQFENLHALSLRNNLLLHLPPEISVLDNIRRINIDDNPLIPDGSRKRWGLKEIDMWIRGEKPPQNNDEKEESLFYDWENYELVRRAVEMSSAHAQKLLERDSKKRNLPPRHIKLLHEKYSKQSRDPDYIKKILKAQSPLKTEQELDRLIELYHHYRFDYYPLVVHNITPDELERLMPYLL